VAVESLDEMETNLARFCRRIPGYSRPFNPFHGAGVCATDPTVYEINELRLQALLTTYPEAEGYIFWMPERYQVCDGPEHKELLDRERPQFQGAEALLRQTRPDDWIESHMVDNSIAMVHLLRKILEARDRTAPKAKIGVGMWGRTFLLPTLDRVLPKNVPIFDMESGGIYTPAGVPMQLFGGMGSRERIMIPRLVDDSGMVGMQFHVRLFCRDGILEGGLESQVTGYGAHGDRFRGEEHHAKFLAEGAWNPHLGPDQFYHNYARSIFGERAEDPMFQAFMALEDKEAYARYHFHKPMEMNCCGPPMELGLAKEYADQPNPYDRPTIESWKGFMQGAHRTDVFTAEAQLEEKALAYMKDAEELAAPGSLGELKYLKNKTEAYSQLLRTFIQLDQAYADFDGAFQLDPRTQREEFLQRLDASLPEFQSAQILARATARTFAEVVDNVSDLGVLSRINVHLVAGTELIAKFMPNINRYQYGKPYLNPVGWGTVFNSEPKFAWGEVN
jgi:hypothetical protein